MEPDFWIDSDLSFVLQQLENVTETDWNSPRLTIFDENWIVFPTLFFILQQLENVTVTELTQALTIFDENWMVPIFTVLYSVIKKGETLNENQIRLESSNH